MNSLTDYKNYLPSVLGILRGVAVHTLIFPIEVVKIHQQSQLDQTKSYLVASRIYQTDGMGGFYKGLRAQLIKTSIKQAWCWPMITLIPRKLDNYSLNAYLQQLITGLAIATVDAGFTTPLERAKITMNVKDQTSLSFRQLFKGGFSYETFFKEGWKGFSTHWVKLSVNWSSFLVAQKFFRDRAQKYPEEKLTMKQLMGAGVQVAFVVSLASAPFDVANTLKQSKNLRFDHLLSGNVLGKMYRGAPLNILSLIVHNIASVTLIEKLAQLKID